MPQVVAQYELREMLGAGASGTVYRALDTATGLPVALKVIDPAVVAHADVAARLEYASRTAVQLYHPNIVRVIEHGESERVRYIASELIEGESLAQRLARERRLPELEAHRIALSVAHALNAANAQRVVHRNLTPENILLSNDARVLVSDFGVAAARDVIASSRVAFVPSPKYAAPEVHEGRGYARSDLYSLGVILFEMIVGHVPFDVTAGTQPSGRGALDTSVLRRAAPSLAPIVQRLLDHVPSHRYADADDLIDALLAIQTLNPVIVPDAELARAAHRPDVTRAAKRTLSGTARVAGAAVRGAALLAAGAGTGTRRGVAVAVSAAGGGGRRAGGLISGGVSGFGRMSHSAKLVAGGAAVALALTTAGVLAVNNRDTGDSPRSVVAGEPTSAGGGTVQPTSTRERSTPIAPAVVVTVAATTVPDSDSEVAGSAVTPAGVGPSRRPAGVIPAQVAAPRPSSTRAAATAAATTAPLPTATASIAPAPTNAVPSATRAPSGGGGGGGGVVPTHTPAPLPTPLPPTATATPGLVTLSVATGTDWQVYWDDDLNDRIGRAQHVCLRREPAPVPSNCPANATSWDATGNGWSASIAGARWIWAPGVDKDDWHGGEEYSFERCFDIPGEPTAGSIEVAADHGANVYVNGVWIRWVNGANNVRTSNIVAQLDRGENCVVLWGANGNACGNCFYQDNPAGVLGRVTVTYLED